MLSLLIAAASVAFQHAHCSSLAAAFVPARDFTFTGPCATAAERPSRDSFLRFGPGTGQLLMAIEACRSKEGCSESPPHWQTQHLFRDSFSVSSYLAEAPLLLNSIK